MPLRMLRALAGLGLAMGLHAAQAHDVQARVDAGPPRAVTLTYGDGEPFAFELYELRASAQAREGAPLQTGRTTEQGVVTVDEQAARGQPLRLRAFSLDGHGVDIPLPAAAPAALPAAASATAPAPSRAAPAADTPGGRLLRGALGLAAIAALYGVYLLVHRRRRRAAA